MKAKTLRDLQDIVEKRARWMCMCLHLLVE